MFSNLVDVTKLHINPCKISRMNPFFYIVAFFLLIQSSCGSKTNQHSDSSAGRVLEFVGKLDFINADGDKISTISIALAEDDKTRSMGLMDVKTLGKDQGMLFIFPSEMRQSFWMANTPLPLDLIFVNEKSEIVSIHQNAKPFSTQSIDSEYPAKYVVEVNAGYSVRHDLQLGNIIQYSIH
jgi:uncharacterized membrane protein (UPF0127 family)